MRKRLSLLLAAALLFCALPRARADGALPWDGPGFETPEAAVLCFLEGMGEQDLSKMLSAFAWEKARGADSFEEGITSNGYYRDTAWPAFPEDDGLLSQVNAALLLARRLGPIRDSFRLFTAPAYGRERERTILYFRSDRIRTAEDADALLASFDMSHMAALSGLRVQRILTPDEITDGKYSGSKRAAQNLEKLRRQYAADEVQERAAYFSVSGLEYVFAPVLGRYGDRWYMVADTGQIASSPLQIYGDSDGAFKLTGGEAEPPAAPGADTETDGFCLPWRETGGGTPEEAVALYLEGLRQGDLAMMLSAFAWDSLLQNVSFRSAALEARYYDGRVWPAFPEGSRLLDSLDACGLAERRIDAIRASLLRYAASEIMVYSDWVKANGVFVQRKEASAFAGRFSVSRMEALKGLEIIRFLQPREISEDYTEELAEDRDSVRILYGADERIDLAVRFQIPGLTETFTVMPELARYGNRWYITRLDGPLANMAGVRRATAFWPAQHPDWNDLDEKGKRE